MSFWLMCSYRISSILDENGRGVYSIDDVAKLEDWHGCITSISRSVYRRISSRCSLLDSYYEPKISNFGNTIISNHGENRAARVDYSEGNWLLLLL
ncbi:hypothetical protein G4B88_026606 [Cannabis sativa]|uniref:Uncharacterized protein n=1 Tax=Cannabis sativa TaxID=3483 RepID=A0A7J6GQX0_CANSA|nr:hypothetical protein G4B88_026606 [Cannabis sativa]